MEKLLIIKATITIKASLRNNEYKIIEIFNHINEKIISLVHRVGYPLTEDSDILIILSLMKSPWYSR